MILNKIRWNNKEIKSLVFQKINKMVKIKGDKGGQKVIQI